MGVYGGIETGGSKWECAIGTSPADLRATESIPTTMPAETIGHAVAFFERAGPPSTRSGSAPSALSTCAVGEGIDGYVTAPALGSRSGVLGAIALAESAC